VSTSAAASSDGLELAIAVAQETLAVSLRNRAGRPLDVVFAVDGPEGSLHDHLEVRLDGARRRRLLFTGNRNSATSGVCTLAAGATATDRLELQRWAQAPLNGGERLAPGQYRLTATYRPNDPAAWTGSITAGPVDLVIGL